MPTFDELIELEELMATLGLTKPLTPLESERRAELEQAFVRGWNSAIEAAVLKTPGGSVCDPQAVADDIRTLTVNVK